MFTQVYVCYVFRHSVMFDSFATPWTVIHQAPQSMEFFRQKCWSGLPFLPSEDLPDTGIELGLLCLLHWQVDSYQCTIWKAHTQVYAYFRIHLIINTKYVQFLIYQLCLNKAVKKRNWCSRLYRYWAKWWSKGWKRGRLAPEFGLYLLCCVPSTGPHYLVVLFLVAILHYGLIHIFILFSNTHCYQLHLPNLIGKQYVFWGGLVLIYYLSFF